MDSDTKKPVGQKTEIVNDNPIANAGLKQNRKTGEVKSGTAVLRANQNGKSDSK